MARAAGRAAASLPHLLRHLLRHPVPPVAMELSIALAQKTGTWVAHRGMVMGGPCMVLGACTGKRPSICWAAMSSSRLV